MATLEEAVVKGLAGDKGLYMPERIARLDEGTIDNMKNQSFHEIACTVAQAFLVKISNRKLWMKLSKIPCHSKLR